MTYSPKRDLIFCSGQRAMNPGTGEMNDVYNEFSNKPHTSRATIEGKRTFGGLGVKINLIAEQK
jgi:enamine deaminase RidA (YjgF/YER057c/UK114 family)